VKWHGTLNKGIEAKTPTKFAFFLQMCSPASGRLINSHGPGGFMNKMKPKKSSALRNTGTSQLQPANSAGWQNRTCRFGLKYPPCTLGPATGVILEVSFCQRDTTYSALVRKKTYRGLLRRKNSQNPKSTHCTAPCYRRNRNTLHNTLQKTATHCNTLQQTANFVVSPKSQHTATFVPSPKSRYAAPSCERRRCASRSEADALDKTLLNACVAACCSLLQIVAVCSVMLQCVAACCSVLCVAIPG